MTDPSPPLPTPNPAPGTGSEAARDPFSLTLGDVYLVSKRPAATGAPGDAAPDEDSGAQDMAVPGFSLLFDQIGLTLLRPGGGVGAVLPWSGLARVVVTDWARTPDGAPALLVEATTQNRTHRFLVATSDPAGLRAVVEEVVAARTEPQRRAGRGRRIAALVALGLLVAAGVAIALLVTVGGVKL